jgi:hypothetical protein
MEQAVPVGWPQLCAIVHAVFAEGIADSEWTARVKDRAVELGFRSPDSETTTRAIRAVERVQQLRADVANALTLPRVRQSRARMRVRRPKPFASLTKVPFDSKAAASGGDSDD